jgi:hypothetical protein
MLASVESFELDFGICANANETYCPTVSETEDVDCEKTSAAIVHEPRKANGRSASAPRKSSQSRSADREIYKLSALRGHPINSKVVDPLTRFQLRSKPARLSTTSGPGFRWVIGISKLWENFWVPPARSRWFDLLAETNAIELFQSKLKRFPLSNQPCRKVSRNSFEKRPQFVDGHCVQSASCHDNPHYD